MRGTSAVARWGTFETKTGKDCDGGFFWLNERSKLNTNPRTSVDQLKAFSSLVEMNVGFVEITFAS
jgi:hypothetical protein